MPIATDVLLTKTDAELQFFVENPSYYHPGLVAAARQELRHRGLGPPPQASEASLSSQPAGYETSGEHEEAPPGTRRPVLITAFLLGLAGVSGVFFWVRQPAAAPAASLAAKPKATTLKLETVESYAIPHFDIDQLVADQLARVPAAEKQTPQTLRQFKGLTRRFWAAETQTEHLTAQAYAGKANPSFTEQTEFVRETWRDWNKAVVYSYHLGPVMQAQCERMGKVASSQQHVLAKLPGLLEDKAFLKDKEMQARDNEVQDWMAGLRPVSPVTGKAYRTTVLDFTP
jgi:hypothetical protein